MNNTVIILGIVLVLIGAMLITLGVVRRHAAKYQIMDGPGMVRETDIKSLYYSYGGSDLGESYSISLSGDKLTIIECEGNGSKTKRRETYVGAAIYTDLDAIVEEYGIKNWTDLPKDDMFALDAPSTSFAVTFADGLSINVNSYEVLPEGGWTAVNEIVSILENEMK